MVYGICGRCSHTQDLWRAPYSYETYIYQRCFSCGSWQRFTIVRQIEQPDGSVIEVVG